MLARTLLLPRPSNQLIRRQRGIEHFVRGFNAGDGQVSGVEQADLYKDGGLDRKSVV